MPQPLDHIGSSVILGIGLLEDGFAEADHAVCAWSRGRERHKGA